MTDCNGLQRRGILSIWTDGASATVWPHRIPHVKSIDKETRSKVKHWFGSDSSEEEEENEEEKERDWSTVERQKNYQEKKDKMKKKKMRKREELYRKAQNMIRLGPIKKEEFGGTSEEC